MKLSAFAKVANPRQAVLVELRYFAPVSRAHRIFFDPQPIPYGWIDARIST